VSYGALFEMNDSLTLAKLAEVTKNPNIIKTVFKLKADLFQVIRYANQSVEYNTLTEVLEIHQQPLGIAMAFFMGSRELDGTFYRGRYKEYIEDVTTILDHLEVLNSKPEIISTITSFLPFIAKHTLKTQIYIKETREQLKNLDEKLTSLRSREEAELLKSRIRQATDALGKKAKAKPKSKRKSKKKP
jgi:hypothetical protein